MPKHASRMARFRPSHRGNRMLQRKGGPPMKVVKSGKSGKSRNKPLTLPDLHHHLPPCHGHEGGRHYHPVPDLCLSLHWMQLSLLFSVSLWFLIVRVPKLRSLQPRSYDHFVFTHSTCVASRYFKHKPTFLSGLAFGKSLSGCGDGVGGCKVQTLMT